MKYQVWDTAIGKCFGSFASVDEATGYVRALLSANSTSYVDDLVISDVDDEWGDNNISGAALLGLVQDEAPFERPSDGWTVATNEPQRTRPAGERGNPIKVAAKSRGHNET